MIESDFDTQEPKIAVVLPAFKHSVLAADALSAALGQDCRHPYVIVIVNDGCPNVETHEVCAQFAQAYPGRIAYISQRNAGLSAARNSGILYALERWRSVEAVYLLDADNMISRNTLRRAYEALKKHPDAGWIYPDIDMFGFKWNGDFAGPYSVLSHLRTNVSEAGSMIRRAVFEKGVYFDEAMRLGYEDWEFWLHAAEKGFRGRHLENFGFRYRKRAESMVADSARDHAEIYSYIRRKHKQLFAAKNLLSLEQQEAPRYAVYDTDQHRVRLTCDIGGKAEDLSVTEFVKCWWRQRQFPSRYHVPPFLVFMSTEVQHELAANGLLQWVMWRAETELESVQFFFLKLLPSDGSQRVTLRVEEQNSGAHLSASLLVVKSELINLCVMDPLPLWINSLSDAAPHPKCVVCTLEIPDKLFDAAGSKGDVVRTLLMSVEAMKKSGFRAAAEQAWSWKVAAIPPRRELYRTVREEITGGAPVVSRARRNAAERHIGFVLPFCEFGGVEKVAFCVARELRRQGWTPHLFVTESTSADLLGDWGRVFESVYFLSESSAGKWTGRAYYGTATSEWANGGDHGRLVGLMAFLDVVVNCHSGDAHGAMAKLRRLGIKTANYLHVTDVTPNGRTVGHPYLALAYEHAYDWVISCSHAMTARVHALGVPQAKLITIPNAPGYPAPKGAARQQGRRRAVATAANSLNVLFLGRLDRQKGIDRLAEVVAGTQGLKSHIRWRLVGGRIIGDGEGMDAFPVLKQLVEPPVRTPLEIDALYDWADVLVMVSRWEGLPLTILEAMRKGVVPVTTLVGAIGESIEHDVDGILIPEFRAEDCVGILEALAVHPERLARLSANASARAAAWSWEESCRPLLQALAPLQDAAAPARRAKKTA